MRNTRATGPRSFRPDERGILGGSTMPRVNAAIKDAIRNKYAWPGGYPLYLLTADGCALCVECGRKEFKQIAYAAHHDIKHDGSP